MRYERRLRAKRGNAYCVAPNCSQPAGPAMPVGAYFWLAPTRAHAFSSIAGRTACTRLLSRPAATVG